MTHYDELATEIGALRDEVNERDKDITTLRAALILSRKVMTAIHTAPLPSFVLAELEREVDAALAATESQE